MTKFFIAVIEMYFIIKIIYSVLNAICKVREDKETRNAKEALAIEILALPNWRDGDLFLQNHDLYGACIDHLCEYSFNALNAMAERLRREG